MVTLTRAEAGRRLSAGLAALVRDVPVVMAISPGGVRVASEIARAFEAPLDVIAVTRLEVPGRLHSTFGAVADGAAIVLRHRVRELGLPDEYVTGLVDLARREVDRIAAGWRGGAPSLRLGGQTVILVDDGSTDAIQVAAAARALHDANPARLILAAPCVTPDLRAALANCCDERVVLYDVDSPESMVICDPDFTQTTRFDVRTMVRSSRLGHATAVGP